MASELRKQIRITTRGVGCPNACGGTGLQLYNQFENGMNRLMITVRVCPCVRLVVKGQKVLEETKNAK